jgi:hypothetical protein
LNPSYSFTDHLFVNIIIVCPRNLRYFIVSYALNSDPAKVVGRKLCVNKTIFFGELACAMVVLYRTLIFFVNAVVLFGKLFSLKKGATIMHKTAINTRPRSSLDILFSPIYLIFFID